MYEGGLTTTETDTTGEDCPEWSESCEGTMPESTYEDNTGEWADTVEGVADPRTSGTGGDATNIEDELASEPDYWEPTEDGLPFDLPDLDDVPLWAWAGLALVVLVLLSDYAALGAAALDNRPCWIWRPSPLQ